MTFTLDLENEFDSDAAKRSQAQTPSPTSASSDSGDVPTYELIVPRNCHVHILSIGAGGGGGGSGDRTGFGQGGRKGERVVMERTLYEGTYNVFVGVGGNGGQCSRRKSGGKNGGSGTFSGLEHKKSLLRIAPAKGGAGGKHDRPEADKNGEPSQDRTGKTVPGGKGGTWQKNGAAASGWGAGGGGAGEQSGDYLPKHGGRGGDGYFRAIVISYVDG